MPFSCFVLGLWQPLLGIRHLYHHHTPRPTHLTSFANTKCIYFCKSSKSSRLWPNRLQKWRSFNPSSRSRDYSTADAHSSCQDTARHVRPSCVRRGWSDRLELTRQRSARSESQHRQLWSPTEDGSLSAVLGASSSLEALCDNTMLHELTLILILSVLAFFRILSPPRLCGRPKYGSIYGSDTPTPAPCGVPRLNSWLAIAVDWSRRTSTFNISVVGV